MQNVKGTNDYWGKEQALRKKVQSVLETVFALYDFEPMETPILHEEALLVSKYAGGEEILKEMYRLHDQGGRNLALRYDLTLPLAKVVANNSGLELPFKRYEIGKVFRDGPVKRGRMREFIQCDADAVGIAGPVGEAELMQLAADVFGKLGIPVIIRWNNRKLLGELLDCLGVPSAMHLTVMLTLDKLAKIGAEGVGAELAAKGLSDAVITRTLALNGEEPLRLAHLLDRFQLEAKGGAQEARALQLLLQQTGLDACCTFDPFLSRGLSFYTGTVYEIADAAGVYTSSLGGGGRYDRMIGLLAEGREVSVPAVGLSFGMEAIMEMLRSGKHADQTPRPQVLVVRIGEEASAEALRTAFELRQANIRTRVASGDRKLKKLLSSASAQGIRFVVLIGSEEISAARVRLKDMVGQTEQVVPLQQAIRCMEVCCPPRNFT